MTHDQIDRMVRQANPVPSLSVLEADMPSMPLPHSEWRRDMTSDTRVDVQRPSQQKRGWVIALAACAAVLIGALVVFQPWNPAPTAGASAVETANSYLEAYFRFDADAAVQYLSPEALQSQDGSETFRRTLRQLEAWHYKWPTHDCHESAPKADAGVVVICSYDYYALGSDEIGLDPFTGDADIFTIDNGVIVDLTQDSRTFNEFSATMWDPMQAWVLANHPDDFDVLYGDSSWLTDESITLWSQRVDDYVAYVNSSG
jgi:hypothetical protein